MSANSNGGTNAQHNASLIKQGFIVAGEKTEIPTGTEYLFSMYKEIRFSKIQPNTLIPRDALTFSALNDYQKLNDFKLSALEASALLSIDATYNNSSN